MRAALGRLPVEGAVPAAVAATVVAFALGSSSVHWLKQGSLVARWVVLLVLLVLVTALFLLRVAWSRARPFALAAWLVLLALISAAWSVTPQTTLERAASLGILFVTAFLLATSAASLALIERVLVAILAGTVVVALIGLLLLAVDRHAALQPASPGVPTRFRGLGEDPDTAALLFAVVLPVAAWGVVRGGRRQRRVAAFAAFLLLDASIVGAISRGALAAGFLGVLVVAVATPTTWPARRAYVLATVVLAGLSYGLTTIPSPRAETTIARTASPGRPAAGFVDANRVYPLDEEVGSRLPGPDGRPRAAGPAGRGGRLAAWGGALGQVADRPGVGYGFGTEDRVFVDRYRGFAGGLVHNYYIGLLLQLGALGLASFAALVLLSLARAGRAYGRLGERDRIALVACAGMVCAGLAAAVVQSYLTSVGNIATVSFWIGVFLLTALGDPRSVWPWRPPIE
jgi:O-antigen ligase